MNTTEIPVIGPDKVMDVRFTPCSIKHGVILQNWRELPVGEHFTLRNGHDPVPLRYQIEAQYPDTLRWEYVSRAAEDVSVKLTKIKETLPVGETPSACGGH